MTPLWTVARSRRGNRRTTGEPIRRHHLPPSRSTAARSRPTRCSSPSRATSSTGTIIVGACAGCRRRCRAGRRRLVQGAWRRKADRRARSARSAARHGARRASSQQRASIVAVTGSAGKTTTKDAIRTVLAHRWRDALLDQELQQSLGRAADAGAHAARGAVRRVRGRHEPRRRDHAAGARWFARTSR